MGCLPLEVGFKVWLFGWAFREMAGVSLLSLEPHSMYSMLLWARGDVVGLSHSSLIRFLLLVWETTFGAVLMSFGGSSLSGVEYVLSDDVSNFRVLLRV